jgi:hypothetical protein
MIVAFARFREMVLFATEWLKCIVKLASYHLRRKIICETLCEDLVARKESNI